MIASQQTIDTTSEPRSLLRFGNDVCADQREQKFLPSVEAVKKFWTIAMKNILDAGRDQVFATGYTRTTYFDTADFSYYRSSAVSHTSRIRVREYASFAWGGSPVASGLCFLEFKQTVSGVRAKSRVALRPDEVNAYLAELVHEQLRPCLTTWYRRTALEDKHVRVTLDDHIAFCTPTQLGEPNLGATPPTAFAVGPTFVLEVKLWDEPNWLPRALEGLSEAVGFSKYTSGMREAEQRGLIRCG